MKEKNFGLLIHSQSCPKYIEFYLSCLFFLILKNVTNPLSYFLSNFIITKCFTLVCPGKLEDLVENKINCKYYI